MSLASQSYFSVAFSSIAALLATLPHGAEAKKKAWDIDRYQSCITAMPYDQLDVSRGITSAGCRQSSQVIAHGGFRGSSLNVDPLTLSVKAIKDGEWQHSVVLKVKYERINNAFFKGGYSPARLNLAVFLLEGKQVQREIDINKSEYVGCETYGRGYLQSTTCPFQERVVIPLENQEIESMKAELGRDPAARITMRISGQSGEEFDFYIDAAEIVSTAGHAAKAK